MMELKPCNKPQSQRAGCPYCAVNVSSDKECHHCGTYYCIKWHYERGAVLIYACEESVSVIEQVVRSFHMDQEGIKKIHEWQERTEREITDLKRYYQAAKCEISQLKGEISSKQERIQWLEKEHNRLKEEVLRAHRDELPTLCPVKYRWHWEPVKTCGTCGWHYGTPPECHIMTDTKGVQVCYKEFQGWVPIRTCRTCKHLLSEGLKSYCYPCHDYNRWEPVKTCETCCHIPSPEGCPVCAVCEHYNKWEPKIVKTCKTCKRMVLCRPELNLIYCSDCKDYDKWELR